MIDKPQSSARRKMPSRSIWVGVTLATGSLLLVAGILLLVMKFRVPEAPLASLQVIRDIPLSGGSSRFDYQSLDPQTKKLFIAHLGAGTVSVFSVASNTIIVTIPDISGVHGILAVPELGRVYASATSDNQVVVIDEQSLRVIARIPGGVYPDGLAYDPADHKLFVSDETGETETVIDTNSNQRVATVPLGGEAGNTQYDPISHLLFVDVQTRDQVVAINPQNNRIVATYDLPGCQNDHSLLIDVRQRLAFVACDGNNVLLALEMPSMKVLSKETVGSTPDVLALDQTWHLLYVSSESGVVSLFNEQRPTLQKLEEGFVAAHAHTIAVNEETHDIYLPLEDIGGQPVLRIAHVRLSGLGNALYTGFNL